MPTLPPSVYTIMTANEPTIPQSIHTQFKNMYQPQCQDPYTSKLLPRKYALPLSFFKEIQRIQTLTNISRQRITRHPPTHTIVSRVKRIVVLRSTHV